MTERWKDIQGYEGIYQVSDQGRVRSLDRTDCAGRRRRGEMRKPQVGTRGYLHVTLSKQRKAWCITVHRLVATHFIGPAPKGHQVNHKNGNKADNPVSNLEWVTPKQNLEHSRDVIGNLHGRSGVTNHGAKLDPDKVRAARKLREQGWTFQRLADHFSISYFAMHAAVTKRTWKHV